MKPAPQETSIDPWAQTTWEAHERAQARRMAALPFARKLEMLEEMHLRFLHMQKSSQNRQPPAHRTTTNAPTPHHP